MKRIAQLALFGALLALGMVCYEAQAAVGVPARVYLAVNISLNGVVQTNDNGVARTRIATRDVISAIGTDSARVFSLKASLLLRFPVGLNEGPSFVVRDIVGVTNVDFEVPSNIMTLLSQSDSVANNKTNTLGVVTESDTAIREFVFNSSKGSFDVAGYTTISANNHGNGLDLLADTAPMTEVAKVAGTGFDADQNYCVLQGTILLSGRKVTELP